MTKSKFQAAANIQKKNAAVFSEFEKFVVNPDKLPEREVPHVNMKYYSSGHECFSSWEPDELKAFSAFVDKLRSTKWNDIYKTGGSVGHKTGLGYTPLDPKKYPKDNPLLKNVSEDITLFELRVDKKIRVHGFRCLDAFYLVYLDKNHRICQV